MLRLEAMTDDPGRPHSNYAESSGPAGLSRAASSMSAAMFARVNSSCSAKAQSGAGDAGEEDGSDPEQDGCAVAVTEFLRLLAVIEPMLQDPIELHPAALRFSDAAVVMILQDRLLADPHTAAEVHQHIADHMVVSAGGKWQEASGVVFAPDKAKLLGEHLASIRWLPFHLQKAQCWTDCVQLLCDLKFLQVLGLPCAKVLCMRPRCTEGVEGREGSGQEH